MMFMFPSVSRYPPGARVNLITELPSLWAHANLCSEVYMNTWVYACSFNNLTWFFLYQWTCDTFLLAHNIVNRSSFDPCFWKMSFPQPYWVVPVLPVLVFVANTVFIVAYLRIVLSGQDVWSKGKSVIMPKYIIWGLPVWYHWRTLEWQNLDKWAELFCSYLCGSSCLCGRRQVPECVQIDLKIVSSWKTELLCLLLKPIQRFKEACPCKQLWIKPKKEQSNSQKGSI